MKLGAGYYVARNIYTSNCHLTVADHEGALTAGVTGGGGGGRLFVMYTRILKAIIFLSSGFFSKEFLSI
jgi:phosphomevalonate kinase